MVQVESSFPFSSLFCDYKHFVYRFQINFNYTFFSRNFWNIKFICEWEISMATVCTHDWPMLNDILCKRISRSLWIIFRLHFRFRFGVAKNSLRLFFLPLQSFISFNVRKTFFLPCRGIRHDFFLYTKKKKLKHESSDSWLGRSTFAFNLIMIGVLCSRFLDKTWATVICNRVKWKWKFKNCKIVKHNLNENDDNQIEDIFIAALAVSRLEKTRRPQKQKSDWR